MWRYLPTDDNAFLQIKGDKVSYMLNPSSDLVNTQKEFQKLLQG